MTDRTIAEKAEHLSRRRARTLPVLAIIYLAQQATYFSASNPGSAVSAQHFKIGAWVVLSVVLLLALATKGFWFQPREVRDLIDDEVSKANRLEAMRLGFLFAMMTAIACYFAGQFGPLTGGETAHLVLAFGLGSALIRFGMLERRAHSDG
jgi:hypothetical protein